MYQGDGGVPGEQQDRGNHIKWNECDWTPDLSSLHRSPTVCGLHREGQCRGILKNVGNLLEVVWRSVSIWTFVTVFEFKKICVCQTAS